MRTDQRQRIILLADWLGQGLRQKSLPDRAYWVRAGQRVIQPTLFHTRMLDNLKIFYEPVKNQVISRYEPWYTAERVGPYRSTGEIRNCIRLKWLMETGKIKLCFGDIFPVDITLTATDNPVEVVNDV